MLLTFKEAVTVDNRHKKKEAKKKRSGQAPCWTKPLRGGKKIKNSV
jgi:hypothetical protein